MTPAVFDAGSAECLVFTEKAGLLSGIAHDLKLRVERFEIRIKDGQVTARFDASSLRVVSAIGAGRDLTGLLSAKDRAEIEANIAGKVLDARRHPFVTFRSLSVSADEAAWRVEGTLSIRGHDRPCALLARKEGDRALVESIVHQPDFGIQPYTAMLGTLRIKPDVTVRVSMPWRSAQV
jgi:hypothetical protein